MGDPSHHVVLVGLMGVGKSTVGRRLAKELQRPFADVDEQVELRAGVTIPRLFDRDGEEAFNDFVERRCWSDQRNSYTFYAGSVTVDASVLLAARMGYPTTDDHSDVWYLSGRLPVGVAGVTGGEPDLYGLDGDGAVVWLRQDVWFPENRKACPLGDLRPWHPAVRSPGQDFARVIAPAHPLPGRDRGLAEAPVDHPACQLAGWREPYEWH